MLLSVACEWSPRPCRLHRTLPLCMNMLAQIASCACSCTRSAGQQLRKGCGMPASCCRIGSCEPWPTITPTPTEQVQNLVHHCRLVCRHHLHCLCMHHGALSICLYGNRYCRETKKTKHAKPFGLQMSCASCFAIAENIQQTFVSHVGMLVGSTTA